MFLQTTSLLSDTLRYSLPTPPQKKRKEKAVCVACDDVVTVKNTLTGFPDLSDIRKKYLEERSLYSLFRNVNPESF